MPANCKLAKIFGPKAEAYPVHINMMFVNDSAQNDSLRLEEPADGFGTKAADYFGKTLL